MTEQQLRLFDSLGFYEGIDVEYKGAKGGLPRDLWETYSAFANTDGGTLWLGISQRNGQLDVHGVTDPEKLVADFWNTIGNRSKVNRNLLSMLPEATLQELRDRFGTRFEALDHDEVQAVVTASLEGEITNQRLQETLPLHRVDITKLLQGLVRNGLLVPEGFGRGTRYALAGQTEVSLVSDESLLSNGSKSLVSSQESLVKEGESLVSQQGQSNGSSDLQALVEAVRTSQRARAEVVEQAILELCRGKFVALSELATVLDRSPQRLRAYVGVLVERGVLELRFPENRKHRQQACRTVTPSPRK